MLKEPAPALGLTFYLSLSLSLFLLLPQVVAGIGLIPSQLVGDGFEESLSAVAAVLCLPSCLPSVSPYLSVLRT